MGVRHKPPMFDSNPYCPCDAFTACIPRKAELPFHQGKKGAATQAEGEVVRDRYLSFNTSSMSRKNFHRFNKVDYVSLDCTDFVVSGSDIAGGVEVPFEDRRFCWCVDAESANANDG